MFKHEFVFKNGAVVESEITGFKGVIVASSAHLNGCDRYFVQPRVDKKGKTPDGLWHDEGELVEVSAPVLQRKNNDRGGFPSAVK